MQRLCCNIIRNLNLVHIIRTYSHLHRTLPLCTNEIDTRATQYAFKNQYFNRKDSTERDNARWDDSAGSALTVWWRTIDFSLIGKHIIANGVAKFTHHTVGSFLHNWNCFVTV